MENKKKIRAAKVVETAAKLLFVVLAAAWLIIGTMVTSRIIIGDSYPLWLTVPLWLGVSYLSYAVMGFIEQLGEQIEHAEERDRQQAQNVRRFTIERGAREA